MSGRTSTTSDRPSTFRLAGARKVEFLLHCSGFLLITAGIGWLLLVAEFAGGDAVGPCLVLAAVAVTYALTREITRHHPYAVPFFVVAGAGAFAFRNLNILYERPITGPLGYSNAAGSLFMLSAAAALMLAGRADHAAIRIGGVMAALSFATVPFLNQTATATVLVSILPLALLAKDRGGVRVVVALSGAAVLLTLKLVILLAWLFAPEQASWWRPLADRTLSPRRLVLWNEALGFFLQNPLTGIGVRMFSETSPTALMDRDTPWPHNEFLQFAAEAGLPGLLLIVALFAWGFLRLWWGGADRGAAVAACALGAAGIHANVDYVLHFPAVVLITAALIGAGSTHRVLGAPSAERVGHHGARVLSRQR